MTRTSPKKLELTGLGLLLALHAIIIFLHGGELPWEIGVIGMLTFLFIIPCIFIPANSSHSELIKRPLYVLVLYLGFIVITIVGSEASTHVKDASQLENVDNFRMLLNDRLFTVSADATKSYLFEMIIILSIFLLTLRVLNSAKLVIIFISGFVFIAFIVSAYSWLNYSTDGAFQVVSAIYPWTTDWHFALSGTFSYKNHFAIYLVVSLLLTIGLFLEAVRRDRFEKKVWFGFIAFVLLITLLNTNARGPLLIFALTFIIWSALFVKSKRSNLRGYGKRKVSGLILTLTLIGLLVVSSSSFNRVQEYGLKDHGRFSSYTVALKVFSQSPITGSGAGTYSAVRHLFKDNAKDNSRMLEHAHNDYLEILATQGVIGFALFFVPVFWLIIKALQVKTKHNRQIVLSTRLAFFALLGHGAIDYSFSLFYLMTIIFTLLAINFSLRE